MSAQADGFRHFLLPLDWRVLQDVHGLFLHHRWLHDAVLVLDDLQVVFAAALIAAAAWLGWRRPAARRVVVAALAAAAVAYVATVVLKPTVDRAKPYLRGREAAGQHPGPVFPEGPGAVAVALAVGVSGAWVGLAVAAAAFAAEDGFVQLARGSHWPSDLYAAWLLGAAVALAARAILSRRGAASPGSSRRSGRRRA